jgi:1-acyl-sn-glycerol-3-phosphate acyltransferase
MTDFDDIRPYRDDEIPAAMQRIADSELIPPIASYLMPDMPIEAFRDMIRNIRSANELQVVLIKKTVEILTERTTLGFERTGLENISEEKPRLYVSNHRDIVLDVMFLQYVLNAIGQETCQVTFGSNLMSHPFMVDFGRSNKMFRTERGGSPREFFRSLMRLSAYIRHVITEEHEPVWIAQRNGRTKDGLDLTDPATLKMFSLSGSEDWVRSLAELNITPVVVSYEWESCDKLKALELYYTKKNGTYEKKPNEDLNSIITGIMQQKGHVHLHFCPTITEAELSELEKEAPELFFVHLAELIDQRIHANYHLYPNNFIAHDLLSGTETYANRYTPEEKARFLQYMSWIDECQETDHDLLKSLFLGIYANPVDNINNSK